MRFAARKTQKKCLQKPNANKRLSSNTRQLQENTGVDAPCASTYR